MSVNLKDSTRVVGMRVVGERSAARLVARRAARLFLCVCVFEAKISTKGGEGRVFIFFHFLVG